MICSVLISWDLVHQQLSIETIHPGARYLVLGLLGAGKDASKVTRPPVAMIFLAPGDRRLCNLAAAGFTGFGASKTCVFKPRNTTVDGSEIRLTS